MTPNQKTWWPLQYPSQSPGGTPFHAEPELARLLGLIIETWSLIDAALAASMAILLDDNEDAAMAIFYSLNTTNTRLDVLSALTRAVVPDGPERRGYLYLLDKISDLSKKRNVFVHGEFHHSFPDGFELINIRPTSAEPLQWQKITTQMLQRHINLAYARLTQLEVANAHDARWYQRRVFPPQWRVWQ